MASSSALQKLKASKGKNVSKTKTKSKKPDLKVVKNDKKAAPKKEAKKKASSKKETQKKSKPKSKKSENPTPAEIRQMNMKELDALHDTLEEAIDGYDDGGLDERRETLAEYFEDLKDAEESSEDDGDNESLDDVEEELKSKSKSKKSKGKAKDEEKAEEKEKPKRRKDDFIAQEAQKIENLSEKEADEEVLKLSEDIELNYFRLGGVLSVMRNNKFVGEYDNFREKVENEFGMKFRKAEYLMQIYNNIVESGVAWSKLKNIGWTKLKEISHIIDNDNVDEWLEKAESMNVLTLKEEVKAQEGGSEKVTSKKPTKNVSTMTFNVMEDQKENITLALEKALEATGSDSKAVALEVICLDYLSGGKQRVAQKPLSIKEYYKKILKDNDGDEEEALSQLLDSDLFEEVFGVKLSELELGEDEE